MAKTEEFKDKAGEYRIRVVAQNTKQIYASSEGYKNLKDCRKNAISASIHLLEHYEKLLTEEQKTRLASLLGFYADEEK